MSDTTNQQTNDPVDVVDVKELSGLGAELNDLANSLEDSTDKADMAMVEGLKPLMHKPNWLMDVTFLLKGTSGELRIHVNCGLSLSLDFTALFNGGMASKDLEAASLAVRAKQVGGETLGEELTGIVTDAVTPQALGELVAVATNTFSVLQQGSEVACSLPQKGYALLRRADGLVWFNFPWLLTPQTAEGRPVFNLDGHLFKEHVYVAEQVFLTTNHVEQRYAWQDLTGVNDVSIEMKVVFNKM